MKRMGRGLLSVFSAIIVISAGITSVAACLICLVEALGLTEMLAGFALYVFLLQALPIAATVAGVFGVIMVVSGFLLKQKYPEYIDLATQGEEVTGWLLKFDVAYLLVTVVSQMILLVRFWDVQIDAIKSPLDLVTYLLAAGWIWLGLAVVLTVINAVCRKFSYDE